MAALSGCILFPPFFPPIAGEGELVIENATDSDWVVGARGMFPMSFAVGAGEVGIAPIFATTELQLVLRETDDCEVMDELSWDGSAAAVRIEEPGVLATADSAPTGAARQLVEYF